jgi:hypothetical protein
MDSPPNLPSGAECRAKAHAARDVAAKARDHTAVGDWEEVARTWERIAEVADRQAERESLEERWPTLFGSHHFSAALVTRR